jgi:hypothetical protein
LIDLAARANLDPGVPELPAPGAMKTFSRLAGLVGLVAAVLVNGVVADGRRGSPPGSRR